mmetsp:Transcript_27708/g.73121  ORF Transcript_27708/g.73121 Transcript_27708/m.73121 type:complete len:255 (+) Transcript_27708:377-1141(+)
MRNTAFPSRICMTACDDQTGIATPSPLRVRPALSSHPCAALLEHAHTRQSCELHRPLNRVRPLEERKRHRNLAQLETIQRRWCPQLYSGMWCRCPSCRSHRLPRRCRRRSNSFRRHVSSVSSCSPPPGTLQSRSLRAHHFRSPNRPCGRMNFRGTPHCPSQCTRLSSALQSVACASALFFHRRPWKCFRSSPSRSPVARTSEGDCCFSDETSSTMEREPCTSLASQRRLLHPVLATTPQFCRSPEARPRWEQRH